MWSTSYEANHIFRQVLLEASMFPEATVILRGVDLTVSNDMRSIFDEVMLHQVPDTGMSARSTTKMTLPDDIN